MIYKELNKWEKKKNSTFFLIEFFAKIRLKFALMRRWKSKIFIIRNRFLKFFPHKNFNQKWRLVSWNRTLTIKLGPKVRLRRSTRIRSSHCEFEPRLNFSPYRRFLLIDLIVRLARTWSSNRELEPELNNTKYL